MGIFGRIDTFITWFDGVVWGLPLIILILVTGIFLTVRLGLLQVRYLGKALKFMVKRRWTRRSNQLWSSLYCIIGNNRYR